jgi:hypothetical protein
MSLASLSALTVSICVFLVTLSITHINEDLYEHPTEKQCRRRFASKGTCREHMLMRHLIAYDESAESGYRFLSLN